MKKLHDDLAAQKVHCIAKDKGRNQLEKPSTRKCIHVTNPTNFCFLRQDASSNIT